MNLWLPAMCPLCFSAIFDPAAENMPLGSFLKPSQEGGVPRQMTQQCQDGSLDGFLAEELPAKEG